MTPMERITCECGKRESLEKARIDEDGNWQCEQCQNSDPGHLVNQAGNTEDIRNSIRCGWESFRLESFEKALDNELRNQRRATVIKMLQVAIKKKKKEINP